MCALNFFVQNKKQLKILELENAVHQASACDLKNTVKKFYL